MKDLYGILYVNNIIYIALHTTKLTNESKSSYNPRNRKRK